MSEQRRPTLADIETGLDIFAQRDPANQTDYALRIAAHLQAIVAREREQGDALAALETRMVREFSRGGASMSEFGLGIREGTVPLSAALVTALRDAALSRVAIDNPRYATFRKFRGESVGD